jgi:hypothetical protein
MIRDGNRDGNCKRKAYLTALAFLLPSAVEADDDDLFPVARVDLEFEIAAAAAAAAARRVVCLVGECTGAATVAIGTDFSFAGLSTAGTDLTLECAAPDANLRFSTGIGLSDCVCFLAFIMLSLSP